MTRLAWDQVNDYVSRRLEASLPLSKGSKATLVVGPQAAWLSLRLPIRDAAEYELRNPFSELTLERRKVGALSVVEVTVRTRELFQAFCTFSTGVSDLVDVQGRDPVDAIHEALRTFGDLIGKKHLLQDSLRLGLYGELHTLEAMISTSGVQSFESWLGPTGERHDFRIGGDLELEIKSTLQSQRVHTINGLTQLEPTSGRKLYVLSLQYQRAGDGAGRSLPELVVRVRSLLAGNTPSAERFEAYITEVGYRDADALFYDERFELRSKPVAVHVDHTVPRITPSTLSPALTETDLSRITGVTYIVTLEGIGFPYGDARFEALFPMIRYS